MRFIGDLPIPAVYTVETPVTTVPMSCSFIFKNSMIFVADAFDKGSCPAVARPFVFSRNIFCPATVPGLNMPVNGLSSQLTTGAATAGALATAPDLTAAMFTLGWFGSGKSDGADELLQIFLDVNVQGEVVLNDVSAKTIVV